jgi:hypothetical protein
MAELTIHDVDQVGNAHCPLCGNAQVGTSGPQLCLSDGAAAVCRSCGKKHAPRLSALLDLARAAKRTGRVCRHTLVPPMETLLELARAAEEYTASAVECVEHV